jgi:hypothetical protein
MFGIAEGVIGWHNRVIGYAVAGHRYPRFRLTA